MANPKVIYICDKKKCEDCSYPTCKFTTDIEHQLKQDLSYYGGNLYELLYDAAEDLLNGTINTGALAELLLDARNALIYYQFAPAEKVEKWEWVPYGYPSVLGNWVCSKCKAVAVEAVSIENKHEIPTYNFCPQCGAKMEENIPKIPTTCDEWRIALKNFNRRNEK